MKVAIHCPEKRIALMKVMRALRRGLAFYEVKSDHVTSFKEVDYEEHDLVHFMYAGDDVNSGIDLPKTVGIYHVKFESIEKYINIIQGSKPGALIVCDTYTQRQLGNLGLVTRYCPFAFDHTGFAPLLYPKEFTVGYLGWDGETKRFSLIERATEELNIPCKGIGRMSKKCDDLRSEEEILDFYRSISCYVVASFNDGGPIPPQEALLCGRPVITTRVGMMPEIIQHGVNGLFHDGDLKSLKYALEAMRFNFGEYTQNAAKTRLPSPEEMALTYKKIWKEVIDV